MYYLLLYYTAKFIFTHIRDNENQRQVEINVKIKRFGFWFLIFLSKKKILSILSGMKCNFFMWLFDWSFHTFSKGFLGVHFDPLPEFYEQKKSQPNNASVVKEAVYYTLILFCSWDERKTESISFYIARRQ